MAAEINIKEALAAADQKLEELQEAITDLCIKFEEETGLVIQNPEGIRLHYSGCDIDGCRVIVGLTFGH